MKLSKISTEDPLLTAYALGELDTAEAARVAAAIAHDSAALQVVNDIRSTAGELQAALKDEPILNQRATPLVEMPKASNIIRFPYMVSAAAAACFAAIFAVRMTHQSAPTLTQTPTLVKTVPAIQTDVAASSRIAKAIPDGFSDLKPAPFRDSGYRLGKSIASSEGSNTVSENDSSTASNIAPIPANSPRTSALASDDAGLRDEPPHTLLSLKLSPQLPVIDVAHKSGIPFVNPRAFALSTQNLKFTGLPDFRSMMKDSPSGSTYEEILSWSTQDLDKKNEAEHRNDMIELVKKPKDATVE
jgi:hypothetical protein